MTCYDQINFNADIRRQAFAKPILCEYWNEVNAHLLVNDSTINICESTWPVTVSYYRPTSILYVYSKSKLQSLVCQVWFLPQHFFPFLCSTAYSLHLINYTFISPIVHYLIFLFSPPKKQKQKQTMNHFNDKIII